jgi:hypothetical protein
MNRCDIAGIDKMLLWEQLLLSQAPMDRRENPLIDFR